jgi:hypothetical protein
VGEAITDNPVAYRCLRQYQEAGADVKLVKGSAPKDIAGEAYADHTAKIFLRNNPKVADAVSSFVHESKHIRDLQKHGSMYPDGVIQGEYEALRREFLFRKGRRPTLAEREHLMELTKKRYGGN